jgi:hypothetical protein
MPALLVMGFIRLCKLLITKPGWFHAEFCCLFIKSNGQWIRIDMTTVIRENGRANCLLDVAIL